MKRTMKIAAAESGQGKLGTPSMTKRSRYAQQAYELGRGL